MLTDPYLLFASCFATWLRIKIIMGFLIVLLIIQMSLSAWLTYSSAGSFTGLTFPSGRSYSNWNSICEDMPYSYLSPFSFSYVSNNATIGAASYSSNVDTSCPWPQPNSEFRLTITVMSMVTLGCLYVKTPLSLLARLIFSTYAMLFFAMFVLDAVATTVGKSFCTSSFPNTNLQVDLQSLSLEVTCSNTQFEVVAVFDLMCSVLFLLLHSAWVLTKDLYLAKGGKDSTERKTLLGSHTRKEELV